MILNSKGKYLTRKKAMVNARWNPSYKSIHRCTKGIAFFATPHRDGKEVTLAQIFASIENTSLNHWKNSPLTQELANDFQSLPGDLGFISFYETLPLEKFSFRSFGRTKRLVSLGRSPTRTRAHRFSRLLISGPQQVLKGKGQWHWQQII
jgi:hypothetical protein